MGRKILGIPRDLDKAQRYLEEAVEIDPKDAKIYQNLARVYQLQRTELKDPAALQEKKKKENTLYLRGLDEIEYQKHFRKISDNNARVSFFEGLFLQALSRAEKAKDAEEKEAGFKEAENWIDKLKEEHSPESLSVKFMMARLYFTRGDLISATKEAESAKRITGKRGNLALERLLVDLYMSQRQWGSARDAIEQLLAKDPQSGPLHVAMGQVLLNLKRPTDALRFLKPVSPRSLRASLEKNKVAIQLCIDAYRQLKQYELAESENQRLGEATPDDVVRSAIILTWQKRYDEAEKKLQTVLKSDPRNAQAIRAMLSLYESADRRDQARAMIASLLEKEPNNRFYQRYRLVFMDKKKGVNRDDLIVRFLADEKDEFTRNIQLASFYDSKKKFEESKKYLDQAEKLKPENRIVIEKQFDFALREKDWDRAAEYAHKNGELNLDGTEGKITEGRLALAKGDAAKSEGRRGDSAALFEQAIDLMKVGVQKYPSYSIGWTYLAQAYMAAGRIEDAKKELQQALKVDPTNGYANKGLAQLAAAENDEDTEQQYLTEARKTLTNDPWIRSRRQYYEDKQHPQEGIKRREKRLAKHPDNIENMVLLARLYADDRIGSYDKATELYRKALAKSDHDLSLAREAATFFGSQQVNLPAEGDKLLNDMLQNEKDISKKAMIAASLGQFYEKQKVLATADRHYRLAVSLDPSKKVLAILADFYSRTGRLKESLEYYQRALKAASDDPGFAQQTQARMIAVLLALGDLDHSKEMIDSYLATYPDDPQGMVYEGAYHRIGGDIEKAKEAFNKHLENDPDNAVALWQRGQLYLLLGNWEQAIDDLRKAKTFNPDGFNYQHRIALANALVEVGRDDEAINELKQILDGNPRQRDVAKSLIDIYFRMRPSRYTDAQDLIYRYMRRYPREADWPALLGKLGDLSHNWDKAVAGYEKAAEISQFQPDSVRALFTAYRMANHPEKIIQYATDKLSVQRLNKNPEALSMLAWAYKQAGQEESCLEAFDRAFAAARENFPAYTKVIGRMVQVLGKDASLQRTLARAKEDPDNLDVQRALVHLYKMNGKTDQAIQACLRIEQLGSRDEDQVFAHLAKGMLLSSEKKYEKAKAEYEDVLKLDPDQPMTLNNLAFILAEHLNRPTEALRYAKHSSRLQPNDSDVLDTYGWILALNNRLGESAGALLRALGINRENMDALYHLGVVYMKQGHREEAKFRLEKAKSLAETQGRRDLLPKITKMLESLKDSSG